MKFTHIDCHVLLEPSMDVSARSSAQDDLVVEIGTDEGLVGIGETDLNPWIGRACIEAPGTHSDAAAHRHCVSIS
jgi:L-alanine-DL-glutamate epimerase-like enolase superfamily enzyme